MGTMGYPGFNTNPVSWSLWAVWGILNQIQVAKVKARVVNLSWGLGVSKSQSRAKETQNPTPTTLLMPRPCGFDRASPPIPLLTPGRWTPRF